MYLQPFDAVIVRDRPAIVLCVWPDRTLVRVRFNDTGQKRSVVVSEVTPLVEKVATLIGEVFNAVDEGPDEETTCRGCGCDISGEFGDLCRACQYEQDAESAADQRAER